MPQEFWYEAKPDEAEVDQDISEGQRQGAGDW